MKLKDAIQQLKGCPAVILDCHRNGLPEFFVDLGFKCGVEVGVYKGEFTEKFCKAGLKMYAVDPWEPYVGAGRTQQAKDRQDFLYGHAGRLLAPYDCELIRKTSSVAVQDFKDESLDFAYIDGDHSFKYIAEDICEWEKKVRKGGVVSGHDYFNTDPAASNVICHVKAVVDAYTKVFDINNWYVFGVLDPIKEPNRKERFLSWMWFKK